MRQYQIRSELPTDYPRALNSTGLSQASLETVAGIAENWRILAAALMTAHALIGKHYPAVGQIIGAGVAFVTRWFGAARQRETLRGKHQRSKSQLSWSAWHGFPQGRVATDLDKIPPSTG